MLIHSTAASAIHHNLLLLINSETPLSAWKIVFPWNRIEVYAWDLHKYIRTGYVEFQILQIIMDIIHQYVDTLITSTPNIKMEVSEMQS